MLKRTHRKKLLTLGLLAVCIFSCLLLSSCGCKHQWTAADCNKAETCTLCGETRGEPLAHTWVAATCTAPKTCSACGKTEGNPVEHTWQEATCTNPVTCSVCGKKEGYDLKPHNYLDATTEAPMTCSVCGSTKGQPIKTDSRFKTEYCKALFGSWKGRVFLTGEQLNLPGFEGEMALDYTITFHNDGTFKETAALADKAAFISDLEDYYVEILYAEFAAQGMSPAQADEAMLATYGKNIADYAKLMAVTVDWDAMWAASANEGVYFVSSSGVLYSDQEWKPIMEQDKITLTETTLEIESLTEELGVVFTKVTEAE